MKACFPERVVGEDLSEEMTCNPRSESWERISYSQGKSIPGRGSSKDPERGGGRGRGGGSEWVSLQQSKDIWNWGSVMGYVSWAFQKDPWSWDFIPDSTTMYIWDITCYVCILGHITAFSRFLFPALSACQHGGTLWIRHFGNIKCCTISRWYRYLKTCYPRLRDLTLNSASRLLIKFSEESCSHPRLGLKSAYVRLFKTNW